MIFVRIFRLRPPLIMYALYQALFSGLVFLVFINF